MCFSIFASISIIRIKWLRYAATGLSIGLLSGGIIMGLHLFRHDSEVIDGGTTKERRLRGYKEKITSKEIVSFEYTCGKFKVSCVLEDDNLHITSKGGNSYNRDGTYFKLDYISKTNTYPGSRNFDISSLETGTNQIYVPRTFFETS